ncbi:glutamate receptor 2.8-like [Carex rostrata]
MSSYPEFIKVETDPETNATSASGYSVDVFEAAVKRLPYAVPFEYEHFGGTSGKRYLTNNNDLVYQVYLWPLTIYLWLVSFGFLMCIGITIYIMEPKERVHDHSTEIPISRHVGTIMHARSISRHVAAVAGFISRHVGPIVHLSLFVCQEELESVLSKIVAIVSIFVLLILTSSYTASLSSMLTVQQLQPTVTDIYDLIKNGDYVRYSRGSFVEGLLQELGFDRTKIKDYYPDKFAKALEQGSRNGGVAAIVHEIPYIKFFLAKNCKSYTMVGPIYKTAGLGFAFSKGSPLVPDISRAILNITSGDDINHI